MKKSFLVSRLTKGRFSSNRRSCFLKKKTIRYLFLLVVYYVTLINCFAQVTQEWAVRYNGPSNGNDYPYSIDIDTLGNVYIGGSTTVSGSGLDCIVLKYNSEGILQWESTYNGTGNGNDVVNSISVDDAGYVYATGNSQGLGSGLDYITIKYNPSGDTVWVRRYNGPGNGEDEAFSLAVDGDGNAYVTGYSVGNGTGEDYATIKYSPDGVQLWAARFNSYSIFYDNAYDLVLDNNGFIYVTGSGGQPNDFLTIKYNPSGDTVWTARYNGPQNDSEVAYALAVDLLGNVYVTGATVGPGINYDYATVKYNSSGVLQWASSYSGSGDGDDFSFDIAVDTNGNSYVIGYSRVDPGLYDYVTIKYSPDGDSLWVRNYDGPAQLADYAFAIALDKYFNVYVVGYSNGGGSLDDFATIKYSTNGLQEWVMRYNGPQSNASDEARCIEVDNSGNVYVTGRSFTQNYDIATIKYSQLVGVQEISNNFPTDFKLYQNYPNPFNPSTKIKFTVPPDARGEKLEVSLKVFDILGNEVASLVNDYKPAGRYEVEFNALQLSGSVSAEGGYASGVYFYQFRAGNFIETRKMVYIK